MNGFHTNPFFKKEVICPLATFDDLPHGFKFKINLYQFGGVRAFVIVDVPCMADCLDALGVGQCSRLIHDVIFRQVHDEQTGFPWTTDEEDLPELLEAFSKHRVEWEHFDARR